jgi:hypothetical protein
VITAESHALLNILTERDFQDAFKSGRSTGNGAYMQKGTTSRVMVAIRLKVGITGCLDSVHHLEF